MKIATVIIRTLLGLFLLFVSISYFVDFHLEGDEKPAANMVTFMAGVMASGYLMPLAKVVELICGLSFVTNKYVTLFSIVLLPVSINLFCIHAFMEPEEMPPVVFILAANIFLIYKNWANYKTVLTS